MAHRINRSLPLAIIGLTITLSFVLACAGRGPEVLTSTPKEVSVEFPIKGDLGEAAELAQTECQKNGLSARFIVVKTAATPRTRVAKFECVSPDVAAGPDAAAPAAATGEAAPAGTDDAQPAAAEAATDSADAATDATEAAPSASDAAAPPAPSTP